jgi:hypothetical protein
MKKTFYFLVFCVSFGYAQDIAVVDGTIVINKYVATSTATGLLLKKEDFKLSEGRMQVTTLPCKIHNDDYTHTVLVSVVCQQNAFEKLGVDKINDMILEANEKVRHSLKTDHLYQPKEIKMAYIPDSHDWSLTNSFTEEDAEGLVTERLLSVDFDANGKFAVMKRIL